MEPTLDQQTIKCCRHTGIHPNFTSLLGESLQLAAENFRLGIRCASAPHPVGRRNGASTRVHTAQLRRLCCLRLFPLHLDATGGSITSNPTVPATSAVRHLDLEKASEADSTPTFSTVFSAARATVARETRLTVTVFSIATSHTATAGSGPSWTTISILI